MNPEEYLFRQLEVKRYKASLSMTGKLAVIYLEDKNDIMFWEFVLKHYKPEASFYFVYGSRATGSGCQQCLKYKDFVDEKFIIAIDSDFRYLMREKEDNAKCYVLQTYTYSFENHYCYKDNLQFALRRACKDDSVDFMFSFIDFVEKLSSIIYPLFVYLLYCLRTNCKNITPDKFREVLRGLLKVEGSVVENGKKILDNLRKKVKVQLDEVMLKEASFSLETEKRLYEDLGLNRKTTYLYLRGHDLYKLLISQGSEVVKSHIGKEKLNVNRNQYKYITRGITRLKRSCFLA